MGKIVIKRFLNDGTADSAYYDNERQFAKSKKRKDKRLTAYQIINAVTNVVLALVTVFKTVKAVK